MRLWTSLTLSFSRSVSMRRMIDGQENTNPELYTKAQLETCDDESARAAGKVDTLQMLKEALESGSADL